MKKILEICCDSVASAIKAQNGGADRIELCENLAQGGVTPSAGKISLAKKWLAIPVFVLIRPRKADFLYSDGEFELMLEDIHHAKNLGADGIVSGILTTDGNLDVVRMEKLVAAAAPLPFTCHRAFDMCINANDAIEQLIEIGAKRILTSGQQPNAHLGKDNIARFAEQAKGRLSIMACGDLLPENIQEITSIPGIYEFHSAARGTLYSAMEYRGLTHMGDENLEEEFIWQEVDEDLVKGMKAKL